MTANDSLVQYWQEIKDKSPYAHEVLMDLFKVQEQSLQGIFYHLFTAAPELAYRHIYGLEARISAGEDLPKIKYDPKKSNSREALQTISTLVESIRRQHSKYNKHQQNRQRRQGVQRDKSQHPEGYRRNGWRSEGFLSDSIALAYRLPFYYVEWNPLVQKAKQEPEIAESQRRKLEQEERRYLSARSRIVESNLRLVVDWARKYASFYDHNKHDLIQEGNIGLLIAVERFDYRRGNRFSTYASWWIRHNITRTIAERGRVVKLPLHTSDETRKLAQAVSRLEQKLKRKPEEQEVAHKLGWSLAKLRLLRKRLQISLSLNKVIQGTEGLTLEEKLEDPESQERVENAAMSADFRRLRQAMQTLLTPRERDILEQRFGFGGEGLSLEMTGRRHGFTRERARQVQEDALRKLRQYFIGNHLQEGAKNENSGKIPGVQSEKYGKLQAA